jgi:UDP-glucose 4-epimerase
MNLLIIGGAGYIGSHMVQRLRSTKNKVTILDNLSTGFRNAINDTDFIEGDIKDCALLTKIFKDRGIEAVMHFASYMQVSESVKKPDIYYENNVSNTINLLNIMAKNNVRKFIFSSSAAIFGEPEYTPIDESHPKNPINPYGRSKLMVEGILKDYESAFGLKSVCLRYFNAAGADEGGNLGEQHSPETHLIPILLQVASGRRERASVFGTDYPTADGTCIRDYIHVSDLCEAHIAALDYLNKKHKSQNFNLGNGGGFSVAEVVETVRRISGKPLQIDYEERRPGDPAVLVADSTLAKKMLNWNPCFTQLETIIEHAWNFEKSHFSRPLTE